MTTVQVDFKSIFNCAPGLYLLLSPSLQIIEVNKAYNDATMTGRDIIGKFLFDVFPDNPDDLTADGVSNLRASLNTVLNEKQPHKMAIQKYDIRRPDGSFEVRYWSPINTPVLDDAGNVTCIIHRVQDVTEFITLQQQMATKAQANSSLREKNRELEIEIFKHSEEISKMNRELEKKVAERTEELKSTEAKFRHALDNMMEGVQIIGYDWRYLYFNDALARQAKILPHELIGKTMMEHFPGIEHTVMFARLASCMTNRVPVHMENEFIFPDGSKGVFELSMQPVPEGVFILSIDVTARKKAEAEVQELNEGLEQKILERTAQLEALNKELDSFTYSVSHDLRAPLRAVDGFANILSEDYNTLLDAEGKRILKTIQASAQKMGYLIDDLLAFAKLGRKDVQRARLNMTDLFNAVAADLLKANNVKPKVTLHSLPIAYADYTLMRQVVVNLLSNAFKYSSKNADAAVEVSGKQEDGFLVYTITDNGVGFDMKYVGKLFGVFQRLHGALEFEGTGVGLAIVHRIVTKHGGKVWAKGEKDKGAEFSFSLPVKM